MRSTILILLLAFPLAVTAQPLDNGITVRFDSSTLEEALVTLENQTGYQFKYVTSWTDSLFVSENFVKGNLH